MGLALMLITGCSDQSKPSTQIVAKVNDDEITVHQLNNAIAQYPATSPENIANVRLELVEKLINEQLTVQQALLQKLDRSSEVVMQIEAARREILTKAYLKQVVSGLPKIKSEDAKKFYDTNPALFAQRRIYHLQQITIKQPHPPVAEIEKLTAEKSMNEILTLLKEKNIVYTASAATRAAEQIPLPILNTLAKKTDGGLSVIETPTAITIVRIDTTELAPFNEASALERIPQYLMNEQAKTAINEKLSLLKSNAKIKYMNDFSASTTPVAALPTKTIQKSDTIERGIAGIN